MTCIILRPDPQDLFNQLRNMFSSTVLGGSNVIPETNEWYVVTNDYALTETFYAIADQMWRETNPETACCDNLYVMAARRGMFPKPAGHAEGYAKLTGVPNTTIPPNIEIQTEQGIYTSVGTIPLTLSSTGEAIIRVRALQPGPEMNSAGTTTEGTLTSIAPGIDGDVTICGGQFCGGTVAETCEMFRQRFLRRLAYQPRATQAWIKEKILEFPCATRVCIRAGECCQCSAECGDCGCKNCGAGTFFYVFFDGVFPCGIPPQNVVDDITVWLFGEHQGYGEGQVEIGVCGNIFRPEPLMINVVIDIEGCPSTVQKQQIENDVRALFLRICPSMPLRVKQIDMITSMVVGIDVNVSARFEVIEYDPIAFGHKYQKVFVNHCGDLEPACDVMPCLNEIRFVPPELAGPGCT